jgi:hypothetical protein
MATTRGYVAVNFSFDTRTDKVECTANKDMTITGENGAQVQLKAGETFTAVRAASLGENMWYIVKHVNGQKKCSCPATKPCRHEKLVVASRVVKCVALSTRQSLNSTEVERIVRMPVITAPFVKKNTDRMAAPLNGNRGFSLMR